MNSQKTQGQQEVARFTSFGKIIFLFSFHPPTIRRPSADHSPTIRRPSADHPPTIRRPFADHPPTIRRPSADHPRAFDCN